MTERSSTLGTRTPPEMSLTRKTLLGAAAAGGLALLAPGVATARRAGVTEPSPAATANVIVQWNEALLQGVRESKLGPPMVARALAVAHTCAYDAWAAYDRVAVGTRLGGTLRRPARERRYGNKVEAVSQAAYRAAVDLFPGSKESVFDPMMAGLGLDPANDSRDASAPAGVGNLAADAVLAFRHRDGANQLGDEPGGRPGVPYSEYTGYTPANDAMDTRSPLDSATVHDVNRWQPLTYLDGSGTLVTPSFAGAQWQHVRPFATPSADQLRSPTGPARYGSPDFVAQALELLDLSARLTDGQKVIAEYWADGPRSELPPGHWNLFAQRILLRDRTGSSEHELDRAVKLFFALTNAIFDAGCCAWDNKRRVRLGAPDHRDSLAVSRNDGHGVGRPRKGHTADRGRGMVPVPADELPDAAVRRVLVGSQQLQRRRCRDPPTVHRQRPLRRLRHGLPRQLTRRARARPGA